MLVGRSRVCINPTKGQRRRRLPMVAIILVLRGRMCRGMAQVHMGRASRLMAMANHAKPRQGGGDHEATGDEGYKPMMLSMGIDHMSQTDSGGPGDERIMIVI